MSVVWEGEPAELTETWISVENIQLAAKHCNPRDLIEDVEIRTGHVLLVVVIKRRTYELMRAPDRLSYDEHAPEVIRCFRALRAEHLLEAV